MLDRLGQTMKNAMNRLANAIFVDRKIIDDVIKELRRSMLEADIDLKLIDRLCDKIRQKAGEKISGLEKREQLVNLIHNELTEILGKEQYELKIDRQKKPFKIMLLGLYGCGKTTNAVKLAFYYHKRGMKVALLGLDVWRPAASEQLEQLANKAGVACFVDKEEKNPLKILEKFSEKLKKYDLVLVDTAGRDVLSGALINELKTLHKAIDPDFVILVVPADIGKAASNQAKGFSQACKVNGVVVTRLDGTAKGGGALASCAETNSKVLFVGVGEKMQDIEAFNPTAFVSRLLGMGDLEGLLEKARMAIEEKEQARMKSRLEEGKFTLNDLYSQIKAMQSMGPLNKIAEMIPGLGGMGGSMKAKLPQLFDVQEAKLKRWKFAIDSMTPDERENPEVLSSSRISRIAKGSCVSTSDIREMIKQYKMVKEFISGASGLQGLESGRLDQRTMQKLAKKFGKRMRI
jgi:signal recognition particle subunit SRP54